MADLFCVFGNPVAHSKSPEIHMAFAKQFGIDIRYETRLVEKQPTQAFAEAVRKFAQQDGMGANVTIPFKVAAYELTGRLSPRAEAAGAVNTLQWQWRDGELEVSGDNTDGAGLLNDLNGNLGYDLRGKRVLLLGAGGAAQGVTAPLLDGAPASLLIANRTADKAVALAARHSESGAHVTASTLADLPALVHDGFDLVVNATSTSLTDLRMPLPAGLFAKDALAYDMVYSQQGNTPFLAAALALGAGQASDGLGMLVEQAAESFYLWHKLRPQSAPVLDYLRSASGSA